LSGAIFLAAALTVFTPIEGAERLKPFFDALRAGERVRVTHFGDSHAVADMWTGPVRAGLQARFGDGGRGFVLAGRPWASHWQSHLTNSSVGRWRVDSLRGGLDDGWFGPGGCSAAAEGGRPSFSVAGGAEVGAALRAVDLHFLRQPGGGCAEVRVAGRVLGRVSTRGPWLEAGFARFAVVGAAGPVEVVALGAGEVRAFGVDLIGGRGVVYDALGVNGARARQLLEIEPVNFAAGLRRLAPSLVVLAFGANELTDAALDAEVHREVLEAVLSRVRGAVTTGCLVMGPPDMRLRGTAPPAMGALYAAQRSAAAASGCAFWDTRSAMGGSGAIGRWRRAGWARRDGVHLSRAGYAALGQGFLDGLLAAFDSGGGG
jgi:lysophospholipase L1-like esterase